MSAADAARQAAADAPAIPAAAVATGTAEASILALFGAFLADKAERDRQFIGEIALPIVERPEDVEELAREELGRETEFNRRATVRVENALPKVLAIKDSSERDRRLSSLLTTERRYAQMRTEAMSTRALRAAERVNLKRTSPLGAYWLLDPSVQEHTVGCLVLGMKFWPWEVLNRVHPPRHPACPCRLLSYGTALGEGHLDPADVLDVESAIRAASGVVMEAADAEAILSDRAAVMDELRRRGMLAEVG